MKKLGSLFLALLVAALLCGCTPTGDEANPESSEEQENSQTFSEKESYCQYTELVYVGIDTNPQKHDNYYEVRDDSDFVSDVWQALNYDSWEKRELNPTAMISTRLDFSGSNSMRLDIDCTDVATLARGSDGFATEEKTYYDMPEGTYETVSALLTEYTSEHFIKEITTDLLKIDSQKHKDITFMKEAEHFVLAPEETGGFTDEWQLNTWVDVTEETEIHWESDDIFTPTPTENSITILIYYNVNYLKILEVHLSQDSNIVSINYDGFHKNYEVAEDVIDTIFAQFYELKKLAG